MVLCQISFEKKMCCSCHIQMIAIYNGKKRSVVAKFNYHPDKIEVKNKAKAKFSTSDDDGVSDQFPKEIRERRQKLIVQARKERKTAVLSYDTLYINNRPYTADKPPPGPVPMLDPRPRKRFGAFRGTSGRTSPPPPQHISTMS